MANAAPVIEAQIPNAPVTSQQGKQIPFRVATYERTQIILPDTVTPGATSQIVTHDVTGDGYMFAIIDDVVLTTAGNGAGTTFTEDMGGGAAAGVGTPAAMNAGFWLRMQLSDISGDLLNLSGFENYIQNIVQGLFAVFLPDTAAHSALFAQTTGAGATGGSFATTIRYNVGTGVLDLVGVAPNQSRTVKYNLTEIINTSAGIWGVAPTAIPAVAINRFYNNYAVPNPQSANNIPQVVFPDMYGVIHRQTSSQLEVPAASSTTTHTMRQIGNTIRSIALIARYGATATPRQVAEATPPTQILLKAGSATLFQESWRVRKEMNLRQYGFDMPNGILIYNWMHDVDMKAGEEEGLDWLHTQQLSDLHFEITHSAAAVAGSSLVAITDELINVA